MNADQIAALPFQLPTNEAEYIKHPNGTEVKELMQLKSEEGFDLSINLSLVSLVNMGQLSQL